MSFDDAKTMQKYHANHYNTLPKPMPVKACNSKNCSSRKLKKWNHE